MTPSVYIGNLTFRNGTKFDLSPDDTVVVVGPNNAGKTTVLRDIANQVNGGGAGSIAKAQVIKSGTLDDLIAWLPSTTRETQPGTGNYAGYGANFHESQLQHFWGNSTLGSIARLFCHMLTTDQRLHAADAVASFNPVNQPPSMPLHRLSLDAAMERKISGHFHRAYGVDLIVNRNAGSQVMLHIGERPIPPKGEDRLDNTYTMAVHALPELQTQGDGMRSFAGILLSAAVGLESVLLIDEPETFLHPPQARLLGKMLAKELPRSRQLFLATHSGDFIRGVLDANPTKLRILRVTRDGSSNSVSELSGAAIAKLWSDPLLRHSNILDGLFHDRVIVCEADSDTRFYSAVADAVVANLGADAKNPDVMFTHCGGKDRLALVARALHQIRVPVSVIVDFDVLQNLDTLKTIVSALGGQWELFQADAKLVSDSIAKKHPPRDAKDVKAEIARILGTVETAQFPDDAVKAISRALKQTSPWKAAKEAGKACIPAGDPARAFGRLDQGLQAIGVYIVGEGQLEGFVRSVGNHGPKWVNEVLKRDLLNEPELAEARRFMAAVLGDTLKPSVEPTRLRKRK